MAETARSESAKKGVQRILVDTELEHLPPELRWREWMGRVEAVIFSASEPVPREVLARVVGKNCKSRADHRRHPRRARRPSL
jgi:hypothetical protein